MKIRLKEVREAKKMSAYEIARKIGVTAVSYYRYEKGEQTLSAHHLYQLSKLLGVSADYLIGLTDDDGARKGPVDLKEILDQEELVWGPFPLTDEDVKELKVYAEFIAWRKLRG